jgi:hypothetical protein
MLTVTGGLCADDPGSVEVGGVCDEEGRIHNLASDISKTPWELNELYAVPVGTVSPDSWEQSSSFNLQFNAELESGDPAGFALACANVWQNFFPEEADVIISVRRTITATHQVLECLSGSWMTQSTQPLEINDVSDWLTTTGSPYDLSNESSQSELQSDLQAILDSLNAQPGASSDSE